MTGSSGGSPPNSLRRTPGSSITRYEAEIEDFLEGFNQPTYRGMRVNGVPAATWSSRDRWSGL
jgi:hypothetical protein